MNREEAMRLIAETYAREEMARNEAAWEAGRVSLVLIKSPDDPPTFSFEFQNKLSALESSLSQADIDAASRVLTLDSAESFGGQLGEFVIPIAQFGIPALSVIIVAWMKAKSGRTAKVEFFADGRPKKLEASTTDDVVSLLEAVNREAQKKPKRKS